MTLERAVSVTTFTADNQVTTSVDPQALIDTDRGYRTTPHTPKSVRSREGRGTKHELNVTGLRPLNKTESQQTFITCSSNTAISNKAVWPSEDFDSRHFSPGHSPHKHQKYHHSNGHLKSASKGDKSCSYIHHSSSNHTHHHKSNNSYHHQHSNNSNGKSRQYKKKHSENNKKTRHHRRSVGSYCSNGEVVLDFERSYSVPAAATSCRSFGDAPSKKQSYEDSKSLPYERETSPLPLESPRPTKSCAFSYLFTRSSMKSRARRRLDSASPDRERRHYKYSRDPSDSNQNSQNVNSRRSRQHRIDSTSSLTFRLPIPSPIKAKSEESVFIPLSPSTGDHIEQNELELNNSRQPSRSRAHSSKDQDAPRIPASSSPIHLSTTSPVPSPTCPSPLALVTKSSNEKDNEKFIDKNSSPPNATHRSSKSNQDRQLQTESHSPTQSKANLHSRSLSERRPQLPLHPPVRRDRSEDAFYRNPNNQLNLSDKEDSQPSEYQDDEIYTRSKSACSNNQHQGSCSRSAATGRSTPGSSKENRIPNHSRPKTHQGFRSKIEPYENDTQTNSYISGPTKDTHNIGCRRHSVHSLRGLGIYNSENDCRVITDAEDFEYRPSYMRGGINLSFCGCGFLGMYHLGVATCLVQRAPSFLDSVQRVGGASAGALMAAVLVTCPDKMEVSQLFFVCIL